MIKSMRISIALLLMLALLFTSLVSCQLPQIPNTGDVENPDDSGNPENPDDTEKPDDSNPGPSGGTRRFPMLLCLCRCLWFLGRATERTL